MIRALLAALVLMALVPLSYGAQQTINVGSAANDGTGDTGRSAFQKVNANETELYTIGPAHYIACTAGSSGAVDAALLATAAALGGQIILTANCTVNATTVLISNTRFDGNGFTITAAAAGNWPASTIAAALNAQASASIITIQNTNFVWTAAGGTVHIINLLGSNSKVSILNNTSTGGGNLVANIGGTDVLMAHNHAYNCANSCYDSWGGATNVIVANNYGSVSGAGTNCIQFTGFNTDNTASTTKGFVATGNTCVLQGTTEQGININGYATCGGAAADDNGIIANNRIYSPTGIGSYGILVRFCAHNWDVHDNQIYGDDTADPAPAIYVTSVPTNVRVHHNQIFDWNNTAGAPDTGAIRNTAVGGTVEFNSCYSCSGLVVGNTDATTMVIGNDTGTGVVNFGTAPTVNGYTVPYNLFQWGVPVFLPATGDFNAGVVTLGTAISNANGCTSTTGCYMYFPSGAICATCNAGGVSAAAAYFCQNSGVSTTVFNCFNNKLTSGVPVTISSPTAFVSPGDPAGYTQTTASLIPLITLTIPGGTMGANGSLFIKTLGQRSNNADTVIQEWTFGGTNIAIASTVSVNWYAMERTLQNVGIGNAQVAMGVVTGGTDMNLNTNNSTFIGISSGSDQALVFNCQINTATDICAIWGGKVQVN